ncbi:MAG: hypothetical protein M3033_08690 [Acidobacteriota bacterium]|nr:hypothetical protein [Acidobacteriota bacterium]
MYHTIKRYVSLFVLVSLMSAISVLANPVKAEKNRKSESYVIDLQDKQSIALAGRFISINRVHSYRLNVKQGETVVLTVKSNKATSIKVQSPSGTVAEGKGERMLKAVLAGNGEFVIEINSDELSFYSIQVTRV